MAYCEPSTIVPDHTHGDYFELSLISSGEGVIYTNDVPAEVRKGDIYISLDHETHKIQSNENSPLKYDFFAFRIVNDSLKQDFLAFYQVLQNPANRIIQNDTLKLLVQMALSETSFNRYAAQKYLSMLFSQILIQLIRSLKKQNVDCSSLPTKNEEICYQIIHYIDTHITDIKTLDALSKIFNYEYRYLSNIFTKTTNQTLSSYYHSKRLEFACKLIKEGNMSLTEIAEQLQYSSLFAFSKAFKNQYGISPIAYKKKSLTQKSHKK
jgi:AraC-like DNA-binding protein